MMTEEERATWWRGMKRGSFELSGVREKGSDEKRRGPSWLWAPESLIRTQKPPDGAVQAGGRFSLFLTILSVQRRDL